MATDRNKHSAGWRPTRSRFSIWLTIYFVVALIIPNCVLAQTEEYSI